MKIIFISKYFYPHIGGVENHLLKISEELIKKGCEITVVTSKITNSKRYENHKGISIIRFNQPKIKFLGLLVTWMWVIRKYKLFISADIIHAHDVAIWLLPLKLFFPRKKIFLTSHGWEGRYPIPIKNIGLKKLAYLMSSKVLAVGKYIDKYYGVKSTDYIYGGVDIPNDSYGKDMQLLLYVGRLEEDTGLPLLLNALSNLTSYKVVFCGDGSLKKECLKYGRVLGFRDPSKYYKKAFVCFGSGYLTILEALLHKCIVFTAYDNDLKKDYFAMSPFAKHITSVNSSYELRDKLIQCQMNSKSLVKKTDLSFEQFRSMSWDVVVTKYIELWTA